MFIVFFCFQFPSISWIFSHEIFCKHCENAYILVNFSYERVERVFVVKHHFMHPKVQKRCHHSYNPKTFHIFIKKKQTQNEFIGRTSQCQIQNITKTVEKVEDIKPIKCLICGINIRNSSTIIFKNNQPVPLPVKSKCARFLLHFKRNKI